MNNSTQQPTAPELASASRQQQADALVDLMSNAPILDGETMWRSIAYHLIQAGYHNVIPLTVVVQPKEAAQVPWPIIDNLKRLQRIASRTKKSMPADHECRQAGDELALYAAKVMARYEISPRQLSLKMGLSHTALTGFLRRRGAIQDSAGAPVSRGQQISSANVTLPEVEEYLEEIPHFVWDGRREAGVA